MKLHALCLGKTRRQTIRGHGVTTAYVKTAVDHPVRVSEGGLEGNDVAVHNDAIYAVSTATYDHWRDRLGGNDWPLGRFAENMVIDGLDEAALAVGDRIEIGDEVVLSVAGPRVPCFKLCWALGQPDSFIPEFATSGQSGIYLNVVKTGTVRAGDRVRVLPGSGTPTLALDIAKAIFAGTSPLDEMEHFLQLDGLSPTVSFVLGARIASERDRATLSQHRWSGARPLRVTRIVQETPDTKSVYLAPPKDTPPLPAALAGQFLTVKIPHPDGALTRVWSLSDHQDHPEHYRLTIKRSASGPGSAYMHDQLEEGDLLPVSAPLGQFTLARGSFKPIVLLAGGIGLTPLLAMLKAHTASGHFSPVFLFHCVQDGEHQPLRAELDALAALDGVTVIHVFAAPTKEDIAEARFDHQGFLSKAILADRLNGLFIEIGDKRVDMPPYEMAFFVCGPQAFQEFAKQALLDLGANADAIRFESFGTEAGAPAAPVVEQAEVTFAPGTAAVAWDAGTNETLLELAEGAGFEVPNACRMGVCHTCICTLAEGAVSYDRALASPPPEGTVLLCCARPASKRIVLKTPGS